MKGTGEEEEEEGDRSGQRRPGGASLLLFFFFLFQNFSTTVFRTFLSFSCNCWITTGREMILINIITLAFVLGE